jgi:1,4-dihydroxy-2-naphthoate octaprenyltransferase
MDNLQQSIESHENNILNMPKAMEVSFVLSTTFSWTNFLLPIVILHYPIRIVQFHVQKHHAKSKHIAYSNIHACTILFNDLRFNK